MKTKSLNFGFDSSVRLIVHAALLIPACTGVTGGCAAAISGSLLPTQPGYNPSPQGSQYARVLNSGAAFLQVRHSTFHGRATVSTSGKRAGPPMPAVVLMLPKHLSQWSAQHLPDSFYGLSVNRLLHGIPELFLSGSELAAHEICPRWPVSVIIEKLSDLHPTSGPLGFTSLKISGLLHSFMLR